MALMAPSSAAAVPAGLGFATLVAGPSPSSGSRSASASAAAGQARRQPVRESAPLSTAHGPTGASQLLAAAGAAAVALLAPSGRRALRHRGRSVAVLRNVTAEVAEPAVTDTTAGIVAPEKMAYLKEIFLDVLETRRVPSQLEVFLTVAQNSGYTILARDEWKTIGGQVHPFLCPLAVKGDGDDLEVFGLLVREPNGAPLAPESYAVVSQKPRRSFVVHLIATDAEKYIMKRAEEATFENEKKDLPIIEATKDLYDVRFKGTDRNALDRWLLLNVGAFPDVYYHLIEEHIADGDAKTGLVIADTMRDTFGATWAFPHAQCCRILRKHFNFGKAELENRDLEADHCAVRCFTSGLPLWSLEEDGDSLYDLLCEAKMPNLGSVDSLRVFYLKRVTDEQRAAVRTGSISAGQATMAKAQALLDAVCCGHKTYQEVRVQLRELYEEVPGCDGLVNMIEYFGQ